MNGNNGAPHTGASRVIGKSKSLNNEVNACYMKKSTYGKEKATIGKGNSHGKAAAAGGGRRKKNMNVNVVVRIRPMLGHEKLQPRAITIEKTTSKSKPIQLQLVNPSVTGEDEIHEFEFERCYDESTTQRNIFQREIAPSIKSVFHGYNTTVFAYGATGTGKTFTMEGNKKNLGMIPRCIKRLFEVGHEELKTKFHVELSFLEIYNDKVLDLFAQKASDRAVDLPIRQMPDGSVVVQGLRKKRIETLQNFEVLYEKGTSMRKKAATALNAESSRSHSILMVHVHALDQEKQEWIEGKLHLIDLAGSEDNRRTGNSGTRLAESGKINMSLFVLGKVITALNSGNTQQRVAYRDSKLTRLLQDSLGGSNQAIMICNVSPTTGMYQENLQTLNYAFKAKGIVNNVIANTTKPVASSRSRMATTTTTPSSSKTPIATSASRIGMALKKPNTVGVVKSMIGADKIKEPARSSALSQLRSLELKTGTTCLKRSSLESHNPSRSAVGIGSSVSGKRSSMESKLDEWKRLKDSQKTTSVLKKRSSFEATLPSTNANALSSSLSLQTSRNQSVPSSTATTMKTTTGSTFTSTQGGALRVPLQKRTRVSLASTTSNTRPTASATATVSAMATSTRPKIETVNSFPKISDSLQTEDKENHHHLVVIEPQVELDPVAKAKKLISIAIDMEKKKNLLCAIWIFQRAHEVLPEENVKLVERIQQLQISCGDSYHPHPNSTATTDEYMQYVLIQDLLETLNKGNKQELVKLPSIGGKRAEKIIEAREMQPFTKVEDLIGVNGITEKIVFKLSEHTWNWTSL